MNYILFGGSGFIGTHLIHLLLRECVRLGDVIYDLDLVMPGEEGVVPGVVEKNDGVQYIRLDVRKPIDFAFVPTPEDVIFDLAAVHRTPGHPEEAYFETNIRGAENVTAFAEKYGIRKILFTSSIAPYGASEDLKTEETLPTPNTPYGISKLVAEKIHQIWQARDPARELTIVRMDVPCCGGMQRQRGARQHDPPVQGAEEGLLFLYRPEGHHQGVHLCQGVGALLQVPDAGSFFPRSRDL